MEPMEAGQFWNIIEQSKSDDCDQQAENLESLLSKEKAEVSVAFQERFEKLMLDAYRWDLWAVASIINGGASDDGFAYFRAWLIGQGRERFEKALEKPESVGDWTEPDNEYECEMLWYTGRNSYEKKTRRDYPEISGRAHPDEPKGEQWKEEDLEKLYPALTKKFYSQ
ncbi:DUF4240 domain-containing protein [Candidatus Uhrbacteria bacterium]|nr:DUF4240 domain-containing protein [Candidatus Uhrbacteria bacterium]